MENFIWISILLDHLQADYKELAGYLLGKMEKKIVKFDLYIVGKPESEY